MNNNSNTLTYSYLTVSVGEVSYSAREKQLLYNLHLNDKSKGSRKSEYFNEHNGWDKIIAGDKRAPQRIHVVIKCRNMNTCEAVSKQEAADSGKLYHKTAPCYWIMNEVVVSCHCLEETEAFNFPRNVTRLISVEVRAGNKV